MNVWPVPDRLADAYKGAGHALAAVRDGELVDFLYLADLLPDFDSARVEAALGDHRLAPTIAHLSALGAISVCMCSCWELCEL